MESLFSRRSRSKPAAHICGLVTRLLFSEKDSKRRTAVQTLMTVDTINIDRALDQDLGDHLPDWVFDEIDQSETHTLKDIFPSLAGIRTEGQHHHCFYPITAFHLVQLRTGATDQRWFRLQTLIDQHKKFQLNHTKKPGRDTYRTTFKNLVAVGILEQVEDGSDKKLGLPAERDVAPAFDRTHPDDIRDQITMDDPSPRDDVKTTVWPLPETADRPAVIPAQLAGGRLSNPWDAGMSFSTAGVALTALSVGLITIADGTVTLPVAGVLWAMFSIGIAAALVEILDQLKAGYQYSESC